MAKSFLPVLVLLAALAGAGLAHAAPQWDRSGPHGAERAERNLPGGLPGSGGSSGGQSPQQASGQDQDAARRQANRMTPEDRRNLRRQINEAGQDIYIPRR